MSLFAPLTRSRQTAKTARSFGIMTMIFICGCSQPPTSQQVILENTLNLPVLEGSKKETACLWDNMYPHRKTKVECILVPISKKIRNYEQDLGIEKIALDNFKALKSLGWIRSWNIGYIHGFEKPIDDNCSLSLEVIMKLHADVDTALHARRTGNLDKIDNASMVFVEFLEPVCADMRKIK